MTASSSVTAVLSPSTSSFSAASFTVQGDGGNHLGINPAATINNATLNLTGDLGVGRAFLNITGNSTITADRIGGGGMTGISSADFAARKRSIAAGREMGLAMLAEMKGKIAAKTR